MLSQDYKLLLENQSDQNFAKDFLAPAKSPKELLLAEAKKVESVLKFLEGQTIVREIVIPDKLVSFAVK